MRKTTTTTTDTAKLYGLPTKEVNDEVIHVRYNSEKLQKLKKYKADVPRIIRNALDEASTLLP